MSDPLSSRLTFRNVLFWLQIGLVLSLLIGWSMLTVWSVN